jgi:hypothetical protein
MSASLDGRQRLDRPAAPTSRFCDQRVPQLQEQCHEDRSSPISSRGATDSEDPRVSPAQQSGSAQPR